MRSVHHPTLDDLRLADVLHALSDPVRLDIVDHLASAAGGECACGALCPSLSKSTLSHHLKVLREAGITRTRANGTHRLVSLREQELEQRFPGLLGSVLEAGRT